MIGFNHSKRSLSGIRPDVFAYGLCGKRNIFFPAGSHACSMKRKSFGANPINPSWTTARWPQYLHRTDFTSETKHEKNIIFNKTLYTNQDYFERSRTPVTEDWLTTVAFYSGVNNNEMCEIGSGRRSITQRTSSPLLVLLPSVFFTESAHRRSAFVIRRERRF